MRHILNASLLSRIAFVVFTPCVELQPMWLLREGGNSCDRPCRMFLVEIFGATLPLSLRPAGVSRIIVFFFPLRWDLVHERIVLQEDSLPAG